MNESLQRALNEVSILKKTLNTEKNSHQNTLQQLQTSYRIIEDIKQMLKNEQEKNNALNREIKEKNLKIQQISTEYEDSLMNVKQLIERKDLQIKKYTQIKVTDYDMIRLRIINQVEVQHQEELELLKKEIQKQQFLNNQNLYENKVLKQKNIEYSNELQLLKSQYNAMEQQLLSKHTKDLNKLYGLVEQQKLLRKNLEKQISKEKEKYTATINKYHKQIQILQSQISNQFTPNENSQKHSNFTNASTLIQLKESDFALENQKLKRQLRQKNDQIDEITKKSKAEIRQMDRRINQMDKELKEAKYQIKRLQQDIKESKINVQEEMTAKFKRDLEKKQKTLKQNYETEIQVKNQQIQKLKRQLQSAKSSLDRNQIQKFIPNLQKESQDNFKLQRENQELKTQLKSIFLSKIESTVQLVQLKMKKNEENQTRQIRAASVQEVKQKLKVANAKILNLLKDKIELSQKISRINENK